MWLVDSKAWDLHLRQNLNDLKTLEKASLSQLLFSIKFRLSPDSLRWTIDPFSPFFVNSLMDDLVGTIKLPVKNLYSAI